MQGRWGRVDERQLMSARCMRAVTCHRGSSCQHRGSPCQHRGSPCQHRGSSCQHRGSSCQHRGSSCQHAARELSHVPTLLPHAASPRCFLLSNKFLVVAYEGREVRYIKLAAVLLPSLATLAALP